MREFNTSGPNIPRQHYTIERTNLIRKGIEMVDKMHYFTIWAPRQTGKSTYFRQLANNLEEEGYRVAHINFENFRNEPIQIFLDSLNRNIRKFWGWKKEFTTIGNFFEIIQSNKTKKCVLIIDEVEGINPEYFGDFLHSIRNAYHSRENHCLKSVILVGVSNIVGVVSDNASPFNIADNLNVPYFTNEEVKELLGQHEKETDQIFEPEVIDKVSEITANQPGLVNGFAKKMVDDNPAKKTIDHSDYLKAEHWYLNQTIDKNVANILNKANQHRSFVERLLFTEDKIPFKINKPHIKHLHTNGLIKEDEDGFVEFWVPLYKKSVYDAFYPYMNGEQRQISRTLYAPEYFTQNGELKLEKLIETYRVYVKRRGFNPHREKDEKGNYKSIREAALIYSFETYIHAFVNELEGKIYREADTGLGKSDMIINIASNEFLIETKVYTSPGRFGKGKEQLAYYCKSLGLKKGIYLVFCPNDIKYPEFVKDSTESIHDVEISTYTVGYDETKWD